MRELFIVFFSRISKIFDWTKTVTKEVFRVAEFESVVKVKSVRSSEAVEATSIQHWGPNSSTVARRNSTTAISYFLSNFIRNRLFPAKFWKRRKLRKMHEFCKFLIFLVKLRKFSISTEVFRVAKSKSIVRQLDFLRLWRRFWLKIIA